MKKSQVSEDILDEYFFDDGQDYKMSQLLHNDRENFASTEKWLYLGADSRDSCFAKIGITMGDLRSRSYSSARPSYYLFCAFKLRYNISKQDLKKLEKNLLSKMDKVYCNEDGTSKREKHSESGRLSECYYPIDFLEFFKDLHYEIYTHYRNEFVLVGFYNEFNVCEGEFIDCFFNDQLTKPQNDYIKMILQW